MPTVTQESLKSAILAMDAYHREVNVGLANSEAGQIGDAVFLDSQRNDAIGFYASAYTLNGTTVISFRGTDDDFDSAPE